MVTVTTAYSDTPGRSWGCPCNQCVAVCPWIKDFCNRLTKWLRHLKQAFQHQLRAMAVAPPAPLPLCCCCCISSCSRTPPLKVDSIWHNWWRYLCYDMYIPWGVVRQPRHLGDHRLGHQPGVGELEERSYSPYWFLCSVQPKLISHFCPKMKFGRSTRGITFKGRLLIF